MGIHSKFYFTMGGESGINIATNLRTKLPPAPIIRKRAAKIRIIGVLTGRPRMIKPLRPHSKKIVARSER